MLNYAVTMILSLTLTLSRTGERVKSLGERREVFDSTVTTIQASFMKNGKLRRRPYLKLRVHKTAE